MGRGCGEESYRGYGLGCGSDGRRGAARVPHGGAGRGGRHHGAHAALLPRARTHPATPPRGPHRLVRRDPPGPAADDLRTAGARPHPQRDSGVGRGLRPRPRRRRPARRRRAERGDPVRLTPEALADVFGSEATAENLAAALELGYLGTDGADIVHVSHSLLDVSAALVREGIPLADVLRAARHVREHAEALAELFTSLLLARDRTEEDLRRLRPLARSVVGAELSLALDRRTRRPGAEPGPGGRSPGGRAPDGADHRGADHGGTDHSGTDHSGTAQPS